MHSLIITDNRVICGIIKTTLMAYNFAVDYINYSQDIISYLNSHDFDLIICDTNGEIPTEKKSFRKMSTQAIIKKIKPETILVGIITKGGWRERVSFLNQGGDDALGYPFPMQELLARIQLLMKRPTTINSYRISVMDMNIDTFNKSVKVNDSPVNLKGKQYNILEYMARNKDRIITRSELMDHIWDYRKFSGSNTVDVHVNKLRKKIGENRIETVYGLGYRLKSGH